MSTLWLRSETKPFEKRTPLLPGQAGLLIKNQCPVYVERSKHRIIPDSEYEAAGCILVPENSWRTQAPLDAYILGIKELPDEDFPISHQHVYFPHIFRGEKNAKKIVDRFKAGNGLLFDMQLLVDFRDKRLVMGSGGYWAGVCGTAVSLIIWCQKQLGKQPPFSLVPYYESYALLLNELKSLLAQLEKPTVVVIAPYGNVGTGSRKLLSDLDINPAKWTRDEVGSQSTLNTLCDFNILINCIMAEKSTPLFLNQQKLENNRCLSVIGDIGCDPIIPYNPIPLYDHYTNFANPTIRVAAKNNPVDIMAIDHVTTLLPNESSVTIAEDIFPYLFMLLTLEDKFNPSSPWEKVLRQFKMFK